MKIRSLILIVLIVLLPTAVLTGFAVRMARDDVSVTEQRFRSLMEQRLQDVNQLVARQLSETERRLQEITAIDDFSTDTLRERVRSTPQVSQLFVLNPDGELLYPDPAGSLNGTEASFLSQTARMFTGKDLQNAVAHAISAEDRMVQSQTQNQQNSEPNAGSNSRWLPKQSNGNESPARSEENGDANPVFQMADLPSRSLASGSGWFVWYWDRGMNLVYWQRRASGHIVGAALERSRWMADVISVLPETVESATTVDGVNSDQVTIACRVVNAAADPVYNWGPEIKADSTPFCEIPVTAPLASWRLQCFVPEGQILAGTGRNAFVSLATGILAFTVTLIVMAWLLYRDYARDMREATQQVSFVNQVSHELKTPLTNIRMYAELLERDLENINDEQGSKPRSRLGVINSEAQRLSRLIGNVLTFARQKRKNLEPRPKETDLIRLVDQIVDRFTPSLTEHGIVAVVEGSTTESVCVDPDFVEQILGNLISNVEKYAACGKRLVIRCEVTDSSATIDVVDFGPGIPAGKREDVFRPFTRLSNDLRTSTGTGIGLAISRDLARLHQGELRLMDSASGCWFRVELQTIRDYTPPV